MIFARAIFALLITLSVCLSAVGATSADDDKLHEKIKLYVDKAATAYKKKDFDQAARYVERAQKVLPEYLDSASEDGLRKIKPQYDRLKMAGQLLAKQGQTITKIADWPDPNAKKESDSENPKKANDKAEEKKNEKKADSKTISFTKQVIPLLNKNCANCHKNRSMGQFSIASHATIIKGGKKGKDVIPGDVKKSRLVTLVEKNQMPPPGKGKKLTKKEIQLLKTWVEQGAKEDKSEETSNGAGNFR